MKSLLELWQVVALDMGDKCHVSTARDYETVASRVGEEGLSFLTITLPTFGKDLERSLELGRVAPTAWTGFRRRGGLPAFLGGFLEQIFDTSSGTVLNEADPSAIAAVRQLSSLCAKVELECSPRRVRAAYDKYIECERQVRSSDTNLSSRLLGDFGRVGRGLLARVFTRVDGEVANFGLRPAHGSGATANRLNGNAKYNNFEWTERMDRVFPSSEYLVPNVRFHSHLDRFVLREPGSEEPVRVIHVPKTLKTPRIIAMEPSYMMFMQQALWRELKVELESDPMVGPLIGFTHQSPNKDMARIGSIDGSLATLDLSEASDRVSNRLVLELTANHKSHLGEAVQACRSTHADVPGHGVIPLAKFASMGSALCFPFEAMVFLTIVLLAVERVDGTPFRYGDLKRLHGRVRVYGDDIIVPVEYVDSTVELLEQFGLVVNTKKSFWNGKFRESCGGDFFAGVDVTPVRAKHALPLDSGDAAGLNSWVEFRNRAYEHGYERTVQALDQWLVKALRGYYPVVGPDSPVLGRLDYSGSQPERISPTLHRREVRGWMVTPVKRRLPLTDGVGALMKFFLNASDLPVTDREHLEFSGRPSAVTLKLRWAKAE